MKLATSDGVRILSRYDLLWEQMEVSQAIRFIPDYVKIYIEEIYVDAGQYILLVKSPEFARPALNTFEDAILEVTNYHNGVGILYQDEELEYYGPNEMCEVQEGN